MMTLAEAAARKLCRGLISYDHIQHLLMSTHQAAPEAETHALANLLRSRHGTNRSRNRTANDNVPDEPEAVIGDFIDVEYTAAPRPTTTQTDTSQHASTAGFSMIELMIVVVILAVVAAIAIPSLIASRRAGYESPPSKSSPPSASNKQLSKPCSVKRRYGSSPNCKQPPPAVRPFLPR